MQYVSVATPAEPRGEENTLFVQVLGGEELLESAREKFLSGVRGAEHSSGAFRIVFRILVRVLQAILRIHFKKFSQEKSKDPPIDSSGSQRGSVMALSTPSHGTKTL